MYGSDHEKRKGFRTVDSTTPELSLSSNNPTFLEGERHLMYQSLPRRKPETTAMLPAGRAFMQGIDHKDGSRLEDARVRKKC